MTETYLKKQSGISIEMLRDSLEKSKISYKLETLVGDDKYFRVTIVKVRAELRELFNNNNIIPSIQQRTFDEEGNYIELSATYNFVVNNTDKLIPENDGNYIKLTKEFAQRIKRQMSPPIDRIRIIRED